MQLRRSSYFFGLNIIIMKGCIKHFSTIQCLKEIASVKPKLTSQHEEGAVTQPQPIRGLPAQPPTNEKTDKSPGIWLIFICLQ